MKRDVLQHVCVTFFVMLLAGCAPSPREVRVERAMEDPLDALAEELMHGMTEGEKLRVAVMELTGMGGTRTDLGRFMADKLITALHKTGSVDLVERSQLERVMEEHRLDMSDLIDASSAKRLGKMLGAEAIVTGTIRDLGGTVDIHARMIDVETGVIRATGDVEIVKDTRVERLLAAVEEPSPAIESPIEIHVNLVGERLSRGAYEQVLIREGTTLRSGDGFQIHFSVSSDCHVYVLMYDAQGQVSQLFPMYEGPGGPYRMGDPEGGVKGGVEYSVPPGNLWLELDENVGTETIYVSGSREPLGDLRELMAEMMRAGGVDLSRLAEIAALDGKVYAFATRGKKAKKPKKPIRITGVVRGLKGVVQGKTMTYPLKDGTTVQSVTEVIRGEGVVVRAVSFYHR